MGKERKQWQWGKEQEQEEKDKGVPRRPAHPKIPAPIGTLLPLHVSA